MNKVIDLNKHSVNKLIDQLADLVSDDKQLFDRTICYLNHNGDHMSESRNMSVRLPNDLIDWLEGYASIQAVLTKKRVTRNGVIVNFLEMMRMIIEYEEQKSGYSHKQLIKELIDKAKTKRGNDND